MQHWSEVPCAIDMAPYAPFYQGHVKRIAEANAGSGEETLIVEAGVRYGCSARIMRETLMPFDSWKMALIDPEPKPEATILAQADDRIVFIPTTAEAAAGGFEDGSVDLLHIDVDYDGTHPYVLSFDVLLAFWRKLKRNGEVIIHDCTDSFPGVVRLVDELNGRGWEATYCPPESACPIAAPAHLKRIPQEIRPELTAVVPVVKDRFLGSLLKDIEANYEKPDEIIVIDNGDGSCKKICKKFPNLLIRYLKQKKNLGVNASWNLGIAEAQTELVSVLNDDITIPPQFFRQIVDVFQDYPNAGIVIPNTVKNLKRVADLDREPHVVNGPIREGWAFTIRKIAAPPIPDTLFTFYGDDAIWKHVIEQGMWTLKIDNLPIFHHVGISQDHAERKRLKLPTLEQDRAAWDALNKVQASKVA